jgi:hypothetical protein
MGPFSHRVVTASPRFGGWVGWAGALRLVRVASRENGSDVPGLLGLVEHCDGNVFE